tara:strand:+ start:35 stop:415 length:381 start_codon:yes stop_codon:yes gene_type:complete
MKKLLIFIFSILLSFNSYGEWTKEFTGNNGVDFYLDYETIKKHNGYVYYWGLSDFLLPSPSGKMSAKAYYQVDCDLLRHIVLSYVFYELSMGKGSSKQSKGNGEWLYGSPGTIGYLQDKSACDYVD